MTPAVASALLFELLLVAGVAYGADLQVVIKDQHGVAVADAVVLATPVDTRLMARSRHQAESVDQVDKQFVPLVKAVYVGSLVSFPNKDQIRHQIYSFSPAKPFESHLYAGTATPPILFDKPGVVVLGCNIHDWMVGYIYVSETPFFATTHEAGTATIEDLPAGNYRVRVWHPDLGQAEESTIQLVKVTDQDPVSLEWRISLKPVYHIPRISDSSLASGYP
jgi:plastocyanin